MRSVLTLFQKEVQSFFNGLIAYLVMAVFLIGIGLFFWLFPGNVLETGAAQMDILFELGPWFFLFLIPAITMRAFAEEYRNGTIEFLLTKPVTEWQIVLGKYLASVFLVIFALLPTLIYLLTIILIGNPTGNIDSGATIGAYLGLAGLGFCFASIGILASTFTDNQIVAFISALFLCFFMYTGFEFLSDLEYLTSINEQLSAIGMLAHYRSISRGVVDIRDVFYFLTLIFIALLLSQNRLKGKKK